MQIATAITRETASARFIEFANVTETCVTRTQIEVRGKLTFMRAKRISYALTEEA